MAFLLQQFEQHFPGELTDLGRHLYENKAVESLTETERHLWTGFVKGDQTYEIEIQISPSKVKAFTCDCHEFQKEKVCKHVIAGLFVLRQVKAENHRKKEIRRQRATSRTYQKLSVQAVLQHAPEDQLRAFIKAYARSNRAFNLALKTHFAIDVPLTDPFGKYRDLIRAIVKTLTLTKDRFSPKSRKQLNWLIDQLEEHWDKAFVLKNYEECLAILVATTDQLLPLRYKDLNDEKSTEILNRLSRSFQWLMDLLASPMGPQLRPVLFDFIQQKLRSAPWLTLAQKDEFLERILAELPNDQRSDFLLQLESVFHQLEIKSSQGMALLLVAIRLSPEGTWPDFLRTYLRDTELIDKLFQRLQLPVDQLILKRLAQLALQQNAEADFHSKAEQFLLDIALLEKDRSVAFELAESLFFSSGDTTYYQILQTQASSATDLATSVIDRLQTEQFPFSQEKTLASIYCLEEKWNELLQLLEGLSDLDLLMQLEQEIPEQLNTGLLPIYEKALKKYLRSYVGQPAARKVEQLFKHLSQRKAYRISQHLLGIIRRDYQEWRAVQRMLGGIRF